MGKVTREFGIPFKAKIIRLVPLTWEGKIEIRWDAHYQDYLEDILKQKNID